MKKRFYKVVDLDYTDWTSYTDKFFEKYDSDKKNCDHTKSKLEHFFEDKKEAWIYFEKSIFEYYGGRDFWGGIGWDDKYIETYHWDEGGSNTCRLRKWKGFDDDVKVRWCYDGKLFNSYKELWKAYPIFAGRYMETDMPIVRAKDLENVAILYVETIWDSEEEKARLKSILERKPISDEEINARKAMLKKPPVPQNALPSIKICDEDQQPQEQKKFTTSITIRDEDLPF